MMEELKGCKSYFGWLFEKAKPAETDHLNCPNWIFEKLCRYMFETDFVVTDVKEDEIRAKDALNLRKEYAEKAGSESGKTDHDIDRIWKSVHGKCSVLELILSLCDRLDAMVNEDEEGLMAPMFFGILARNIGVLEAGKEPYERIWKVRIHRFMDRKYEKNGFGGGLFPIKNWSEKSSKDQREVPIWYQMNTWLQENLDEDGHFFEGEKSETKVKQK